MVGSTFAGGSLKEFTIVNKTRAAASAIVGLALTATGALAAAPQSQAPAAAVAVSTLAQDKAATGGPNENHGGAVSALARDTNGAPETTTSTEATTTTTDVSAQGEHGAAVSVVAQDETIVGGPNANHGGAVSIVAHGTTGTAVIHGKSAGKGKAGNHPVAP
jgi:hypothetical protein